VNVLPNQYQITNQSSIRSNPINFFIPSPLNSMATSTFQSTNSPPTSYNDTLTSSSAIAQQNLLQMLLHNDTQSPAAALTRTTGPTTRLPANIPAISIQALISRGSLNSLHHSTIGQLNQLNQLDQLNQLNQLNQLHSSLSRCLPPFLFATCPSSGPNASLPGEHSDCPASFDSVTTDSLTSPPCSLSRCLATSRSSPQVDCCQPLAVDSPQPSSGSSPSPPISSLQSSPVSLSNKCASTLNTDHNLDQADSKRSNSKAATSFSVGDLITCSGSTSNASISPRDSSITAPPATSTTTTNPSLTSGPETVFKQELTSLPVTRPGFDCGAEITARLLFSVVKWVKTLPTFRSLARADQLILLEHSWKELFLLQLAQWSAELDCALSPLDSNNSLLPSFSLLFRLLPVEQLQGNGTVRSDVQYIEETMKRFRQLSPDATECNCLKAVALFKPGKRLELFLFLNTENRN
jgi:hypothetical protein